MCSKACSRAAVEHSSHSEADDRAAALDGMAAAVVGGMAALAHDRAAVVAGKAAWAAHKMALVVDMVAGTFAASAGKQEGSFGTKGLFPR